MSGELIVWMSVQVIEEGKVKTRLGCPGPRFPYPVRPVPVVIAFTTVSVSAMGGLM